MSPRLRKTVRDFWQERTRSLMVVLAIALGIAAFSAVLSSYAILNRELNQGYLATNPASFTLRMARSVDDATLAIARKNPGVGAVEGRRVVNARLKAGPANWRSVQFFVVKDYAAIHVSTITPEGGAWPPATGEVLIERDAFQVARTRIGSDVLVKMASGKEHTLKVSGGVHDVGQAQARMENSVYAYITMDTLALLGEEPYLDQLKILVNGDAFDRDHIRAVSETLKTDLEAAGHAVRRVDIPEPGKHPHADLMGMLLLAISSFGLLVLALSGVLVVNLLTALMASQVRQIGVMKAIGGTRSQIAQIYFGQALLIGLSAVVLALPLGALGARLLCTYLSRFLNFDMTSFATPLWVYVLVGVIGVATPLLAAAHPIVKGSQLSVWQALSDFGVADTGFGADRLDRFLTRIGGGARPVLLALRNSFRRRRRLALTLVTLSTGGLFFMAALNIRASIINTLDRTFASKRFDLMLNLGGMIPFEPVERAIRNTPGALRSEGWIMSEASIAAPVRPEVSTKPHEVGGQTALHGGSGAGATADRFPVTGVAPSTQVLKLEIVEGRDLQTEDVDAIVVNSSLVARLPEFKVGSTVRLRMGPSEASWRVVGIAREAFSPGMAYVSRRFFEQAGGHAGFANSARIALDHADPASINAFREALDRNLEAEGIRALSSTTKADTRYGFDQHMLMIYVFLIVMSVIIGSVGGLGLMTTMSLNVLERRREMGVLRAIGASSRMVWLIVVVEGLTMGLMSFFIATALAGPLSRSLGNFVADAMFRSQLDSVFEMNGLVIWLAASLALSAIASFVPAWNASRAPVRDALGFE